MLKPWLFTFLENLDNLLINYSESDTKRSNMVK